MADPAIAPRGGVARGARLLALVWGVLALVCCWRLAFVTIPFNTPDEPAHLFRAIQIEAGGLRASQLAPGFVGGIVPQGVVRGILGLPMRWCDRAPRVRADAPRLFAGRAAAPDQWRTPPDALEFPNTASYPPVFYAADAAAVWVARRVPLDAIATDGAARLANATAAVLVGGLALSIAQTGLLTLSVVLSLPMTLSLFASASQDALLLAFAALAASLLGRRMVSGPRPLGTWLFLGVVLGVVGAARPPYALFSILPVLLAWRGPDRRAALAATLIALALAVAWFAVGVAPLGVATVAGGGLAGGRQMHWVLGHPWGFVRVLSRSVDWRNRMLQIVGVLGWLRILLPHVVYRVDTLLLWAVLLGNLVAWRGMWWPRLSVLAVSFLVILGIEVALFLTWTPLGAPVVEGVQGRYFLVPLMMVAVAAAPWAERRLGRLVVVPALAVLLLDNTIVIRTMARHLC